MLEKLISESIEAYKLTEFSDKSIESYSLRLKEFNRFFVESGGKRDAL